MERKAMDLQVFCDPTANRFAIGKPWVFGGWLYATNGRIAVRVPSSEPDSAPEELSFVKGYELFGNFRDCPIDWPTLPHIAVACRECNGTGRKLITCATCKGDGQHYCDCGNEHDCGHCGGSGTVPGKERCIFCLGTRKVEVPTGENATNDSRILIRLAGRLFDAWYLGLIERSFTGLKYSAEVGAENALAFTGDGRAQGLLMPVSER